MSEPNLPDLLGLRRSRGWLAGAATLGLLLLLASLAFTGWLSSRCQCRYTAVVFAERSGLERVVLPLHVAGPRRREFQRAMADAGVFVDPDWALGRVAGGPVIYVAPRRRVQLQALAEAWATPSRRGAAASALAPEAAP